MPIGINQNSSAFSICLWMNTFDDNSQSTPTVFTYSSIYGVSLIGFTTPTLHVGKLSYFATTSLNTGTWRHICVTYSNVSSTPVQFYVDGSIQQLQNASAVMESGPIPVGDTLYIGSRM
jgi:hypothetical protein